MFLPYLLRSKSYSDGGGFVLKFYDNSFILLLFYFGSPGILGFENRGLFSIMI